ncbi:MAG: PAS domain-containing protein, partial [Ktedonobacteraceae bacterium]
MSVFHFSHHKQRMIQAFRKLKAAKDRFLALAEESADVFWVLTPQGEMQEMCSSWQTFTGQTKSHCLGRGWLDALHPHDQPYIEAILLQVVHSNHVAEIGCHIYKCNNGYNLMHIRIIPVHTRDGVVREIILCGSEVLYQKLYGGDISEEQVRFALNVSGVGIWVWDILSDQIVWTDQSKALFGLLPTVPVTYQRFSEALHPDDRESIEQFKARLQSGQSDVDQEWYTRVLAERPTNYRIIWPDGSIHWMENRCQMIYDEQGKPTHV